MDAQIPRTTAGWLFLVAISAIAIGGSSLVFAYELQAMIIEHDIILKDIPSEIKELNGEVKQLNDNVIRICTSLDVDCK